MAPVIALICLKEASEKKIDCSRLSRQERKLEEGEGEIRAFVMIKHEVVKRLRKRERERERGEGGVELEK